MSALLPLGLFTGWLAIGERGISSEAMVSQMTGQPVGRYKHVADWPHDPGDLRRCVLLLKEVPIARLALDSMKDRSPQWSRLVAVWDQLETLLEEERPSGKAPKTYALMKQAISGEVSS